MNEGDLPYEDEAMRAHAKEMVFPIGKLNAAFAKYFIGNSYLHCRNSYLAPVSTVQVGIFNVTFEPGCRGNEAGRLREYSGRSEALAWSCTGFMG